MTAPFTPEEIRQIAELRRESYGDDCTADMLLAFAEQSEKLAKLPVPIETLTDPDSGLCVVRDGACIYTCHWCSAEFPHDAVTGQYIQQHPDNGCLALMLRPSDGRQRQEE